MLSDELLSLAEAAELVDRAPVTLRGAIMRGQLEAVRIAGRWATTREAVTEYAAAVRTGRGWHNAPEYRRRRTEGPPI